MVLCFTKKLFSVASTDLDATGDMSPEDSTTGIDATGDVATGDVTIGADATGDATTGVDVAGDLATGDAAIGADATGDVAIGDATTGVDATGDVATGDATTGVDATGDVATGDATGIGVSERYFFSIVKTSIPSIGLPDPFIRLGNLYVIFPAGVVVPLTAVPFWSITGNLAPTSFV